MTDTVGKYFSMGVSLAILSLLMAVVLNLMVMSQGMYFGFSAGVVDMLNTANSSVLADLDGQRGITAPVLYKACEANSGDIVSFTVTFLDGTVSTDYNILLKRAYSNLKVNSTATSPNQFTIVAVEIRY